MGKLLYQQHEGLDDMLTMSSFMSDKIMPLSEAVEGYELFDKMKVQKVVFRVNDIQGSKQ